MRDNKLIWLVNLLLIGSLIAAILSTAEAGQAHYVIGITVDGGGSHYIQALIDRGRLPNFKRFQTEGAWTNNARADFDMTNTLPNHVTIVTGRGVLGVDDNGHMWTGNRGPSAHPDSATYSIHSNKGSYVASVFDVVYDNGGSTALYTTKAKLGLFKNSYNDKIDRYLCDVSSSAIVGDFLNRMKTDPFNFALLHFNDGDSAGHASGWGSETYNDALINVDGFLKAIFELVAGTPVLQGRTAIILTADHGGKGTNHAAYRDPFNYTVPFYVWGPHARAGVELYSLNRTTRQDPGTTRPPYTDSVQPIRNGELANVALQILGLGSIPGSTINPEQNLDVTSHSASPAYAADIGAARKRTR